MLRTLRILCSDCPSSSYGWISNNCITAVVPDCTIVSLQFLFLRLGRASLNLLDWVVRICLVPVFDVVHSVPWKPLYINVFKLRRKKPAKPTLEPCAQLGVGPVKHQKSEVAPERIIATFSHSVGRLSPTQKSEPNANTLYLHGLMSYHVPSLAFVEPRHRRVHITFEEAKGLCLVLNVA